MPGCTESPRQLSLCLHVDNQAFCLQCLSCPPSAFSNGFTPISASDSTLQPPSWLLVPHPQPAVCTMDLKSAAPHTLLNLTSIHVGPAGINHWPRSLTERQPWRPPDLCAWLYLCVFVCPVSSSGAWLTPSSMLSVALCLFLSQYFPGTPGVLAVVWPLHHTSLTFPDQQ